jgi:XisI protein
MDQKLTYTDILTNVIRSEEQFQPSFAPIKIVGVCDPLRGQFLLIAIGTQNNHRINNIVFHAQILDGYVIIEEDNTEGLSPLLIEAGIRSEDIISGEQAAHLETFPLAA